MLLESPAPARVAAGRDEALMLLSESARDGSVPARIALARLLSAPDGRTPIERRMDELAAKRRARNV